MNGGSEREAPYRTPGYTIPAAFDSNSSSKPRPFFLDQIALVGKASASKNPYTNTLLSPLT